MIDRLFTRATLWLLWIIRRIISRDRRAYMVLSAGALQPLLTRIGMLRAHAVYLKAKDCCPAYRAFLATEAASSLGLYFAKSVTFERFGALTQDVFIKGLVAGSSLMAGAFIAKHFVLHLKPEMFRRVMDAIMIAAGLSMLWNATQP